MEDASSLSEGGGRSDDEQQGLIASDRAKRMRTDVGVGRGGITDGVGETTQGKVTGTVSGLPLSDATGWESGGLADIEVKC